MIVSAFILRNADGKYLVELRDHPEEYRGMLLFPAGKVEPGESIIEAAIREANEELGITVKAIELIQTSEPMVTNHTNFTPLYASLVLDYEGQVPEFNLETGEPLYWLDPDTIRNGQRHLKDNHLILEALGD